MIKVVLGVTGVSMLGQIFAMLMLAIIARMYTQAEFGTYGYLVAIAGLLSFVVSLRCDLLSIRLSRKLLSVIVSPLIVFVMIMCAAIVVVAKVLGFETSIYLALLVFGTFLFNLVTVILSRNGSFSKIAFIRFFKPVVTSCSQVGLGEVSYSSGLILGGVLGLVLPSVLVLDSLRSWHRQFFRRVAIFCRILKLQINVIVSLVVQTFFNNIFINSLVIYYFWIGNYELAGLIAMLERCVKNPISMLSASVRNYALSKLDEADQKKSYISIFKFNVALSIFIFIAGYAAYSLGFFTMVLGDGWVIPEDSFLMYLLFSVLSLINSVNGPFIVKNNLTNEIIKADMFCVACMIFGGFYMPDFLTFFVMIYLLYCLVNCWVVSSLFAKTRAVTCR